MMMMIGSRTLGGSLMRWLLPVALIMPPTCMLLTVHLLDVDGFGSLLALAALSVFCVTGMAGLVLAVAWVTEHRCAADSRSAEHLRRDLAARDLDLAHARSEIQLLASRLQHASRLAGIGIYEIEAGARSVWWSDGMFDLAGWPAERGQPSFVDWIAAIHPEDRPRVIRSRDIAERARSGLDICYRLVRPDGDVRHVQSVSSVAAPADGAGEGLDGDTGRGVRRVGILLDVTDKVHARHREEHLEAQLRRSSHEAGIAETANSVLQKVELVLSGVGVAASMMRRDLTSLRPERVEQVANLIASNRADMASFLTEDVRGRYLPDYLLAIAAQLNGNAAGLEAQLGELDRYTTQLRDIISAQQSLIPMGGALEPTDLRDLVEVALLVQAPDFARVDTIRRFEHVPLVRTDRHKLLQIIVCFVNNARDALLMSRTDPPRVEIRLHREGDEAVVSIEDSGSGMSAETLAQLWQFGFTTKLHGHGFGLHRSALAAREIGATLTAHSDGPDRGARFSVRLPIDAATVAALSG